MNIRYWGHRMHTPGFPLKPLVHPLILCAAWGASFAVILVFSPVQPRMTLQAGPDISIIGITPDSRELVALTMRRKPDTEIDFPSGPLQIWNLQTGEKRTVCLPFQDCDGRLNHATEPPLMVDSEGLQAEPMDTPFRDRWLQLNFETDEGRRILRKPQANVLVNLDTGDCNLATHEEQLFSGLELSRTGRWYIEVQQRIPLWSERIPSRLRVLETATGKEVLAFDAPRDWPDWAFSENDRFFVHNTPGNIHSYRVWQLDPPALLYEIEGSRLIPVFSNDSTLLAALLGEEHQSRIVVFDAVSGLRLVEHPFSKSESSPTNFLALQFGVDNDWLYVRQSEYYRITMGSRPVHFDYDLSFAVDLRTNTRRDFSTATVDPRYLPHSHQPDLLPPLVLDDLRYLVELPTGHQLAQLTEEEDSITVSGDGRILLVEWQDLQGASAWTRVLEFLDSVHVPVPSSWSAWSSYADPAWIFRELPSNRTLLRMPAQKQVHWLSPDERTLVTQPTDNSPVVDLWDFPPRKPWRPAALWALLAPALVSLLWWMRSRSLANRPATHQTAPMNP